MRKVSLKARKGDTVASLARRYRVSPAQFAQWNQVGTSSALKAGQALVVYQPNKVKAKARAGAAPQRKVARPSSAAGPQAGSVAKRSRSNVKVARRADD
jgi:membrane-bound lytic murein transglycosylase D